MMTKTGPTNEEFMEHLLHLEKLAMSLAHELERHTEQFASGLLSDLQWRTLASKRKAENLERRIREADGASDAIRESLGILDD